MEKNIKKLGPKEIELLKEKFECLKFSHDSDIVYEFQVPPAGFIVLEGEINLLKRKKVRESVLPGHLVGVYQLVHNCPMKFGMRVISNSVLLILHKSEILEELNDKASDIYPILVGLV